MRGALRHRCDERGMTTPTIAFAVGMSFVVLLWAANAFVFWYVKGAVRQSLDEGIHAGLTVGPNGNSAGACNTRVDDALHGLLATPMQPKVHATCSATDTEIQATATMNLSGWGGALFGGLLTYSDTITRRAPLELNPTKRTGI